MSLDTNIIEITTEVNETIYNIHKIKSDLVSITDDINIELSKEYLNQGKSWTQIEDDQLIIEYNNDGLSLMEIAKIHKRTPGGIAEHLKKLNIIDNNINARGYLEYKESDLYKERCIIKSKRGRKSKIKTNGVVSNDTDIIELPSDISEIQSDISEIKNDISEIKDYISKLHELLFILCAKNDDES